MPEDSKGPLVGETTTSQDSIQVLFISAECSVQNEPPNSQMGLGDSLQSETGPIWSI